MVDGSMPMADGDICALPEGLGQVFLGLFRAGAATDGNPADAQCARGGVALR